MIAKVFVFAAVIGMALASLPDITNSAHHHAPQPYKFGYDIKDKHGEQYRQETGDGGQAVKGSYGFTDARGIKRQVEYVADHGGFRAQVKTNEPGTANQNPAAVLMVSNVHSGGVVLNGLGYRGDGLGYNGAGYGDLGYGGPANVEYGTLGGLDYARNGY